MHNSLLQMDIIGMKRKKNWLKIVHLKIIMALAMYRTAEEPLSRIYRIGWIHIQRIQKNNHTRTHHTRTHIQ